jgi:hypothetical protein
MIDYDMKIHSNPKAQAWAKFFIQTKEKASWRLEDIDEALMLGWFANAMMAMHDSQRTWVELTEEELRVAFGKLYPNDIGILELAENNKDYAVEAIGARHHWTAFKAGARAGEAKLKEKNT